MGDFTANLDFMHHQKGYCSWLISATQMRLVYRVFHWLNVRLISKGSTFAQPAKLANEQDHDQGGKGRDSGGKEVVSRVAKNLL
jgi:hypothetical protein